MRLIDADELMEHVWRDKLDSRELIAAMIENAPTIRNIKPSIPDDFIEKMIACTLADQLQKERTIQNERCGKT